MNNNIEKLIHEKKIPEQLKEYFANSNRGRRFINENMIEDMEELYIHYSALYYFDETEFSAFIISSLERGSEHSAYYYYLKKILDNNLDLLSKDKNKTNIDFNRIDLDEIFEEVQSQFNTNLKFLYNKDYDNLDILTTYILLGKLNLISDLSEDHTYRYIYEASKDGLEAKMKELNIHLIIEKQ